jgi:hypothetical protein
MSNLSQTLRNLGLHIRNTRVTTPGADGDQRPRTRCGQYESEVLDGQMAHHRRRHNVTTELAEEEEEVQVVQAAPRRRLLLLEALRAKRQRRQ